MDCSILIQNGTKVYAPAVEEGIEWVTERKGSPGKLTFKVLQDSVLDFQEGNAVQFRVDGQPVFYGYVFSKSFDKNQIVSVTCYDQLRYFKNKDTYVYQGITAGQLLQRICADFHLKAGEVEDTGFVCAKKSEINKTLFDIVQNVLDDTMMNTGKLYVLYDDFGNITLKNIGSMKVPLLIDEETGQNYDFSSSIDSQTYNRIKLICENGGDEKPEVYMQQSVETINQWGILQYFETLKEGENGQAKADTLLSFYNRKSRNLSVRDAFGDVRIRAGTAPLIRLKLGEASVNSYMVCDRVTHSFKNHEHTMSLNLIGGDFIA